MQNTTLYRCSLAVVVVVIVAVAATMKQYIDHSDFI